MAAAITTTSNVPLDGVRTGSVVTAPTMSFLLKQVYALHKSIVQDLESKVLELTRSLAASETKHAIDAANASAQDNLPPKESSPGVRSYKRRRLSNPTDDSSEVSEQEREVCVLVRAANPVERKQPYRSLRRMGASKQHKQTFTAQIFAKPSEDSPVNLPAVKSTESEMSADSGDCEILVVDTLNAVETENGKFNFLKGAVVAETLDSDMCDLYVPNNGKEVVRKGTTGDRKLEKGSCAQKPNGATTVSDSVHRVKRRSVASPVLFVEDVESEDEDVIVPCGKSVSAKVSETRTGGKVSAKVPKSTTESKPELSRKPVLSTKVDLSVLKSLNGKVEIVNNDGNEKKAVKTKSKGGYVIEFDPNSKPPNCVKLKQTKITKDSFNALTKPRLKSSGSLDEVPANEEIEEKWLQEALRKSMLHDEEIKRQSSVTRRRGSASSSSSADSLSILNPIVSESAKESATPEKHKIVTNADQGNSEAKTNRKCKIKSIEKHSTKDDNVQRLSDKIKNSTAAITSVCGDDSLDGSCIGSPTLLANINPIGRFSATVVNSNTSNSVRTANKVDVQAVDVQANDDTLDETCGPSQLLLEIGMLDDEKAKPLRNGSLDPNVHLSMYETCGYNADEEAATNTESKLKPTCSTKDNAKDQQNSTSRNHIPKKATVDYKYKEQPVRNREERNKLDGFACKCCKEYYAALDLTDEEMKERMKNCSRHRDRHVPPSTPEHFWSIEFPSTPECKARGYILPTQVRPLRRREKKLLSNDSFLIKDA